MNLEDKNIAIREFEKCFSNASFMYDQLCKELNEVSDNIRRLEAERGRLKLAKHDASCIMRAMNYAVVAIEKEPINEVESNDEKGSQ